MALIYPDFALLSAGMSCQTAHQITANRRYIDQLVGAEGELRATPFDWLICPIPAAIALLESGRFFPPEAQALTRRKGHVYWPESGTFFWHEPLAIREFDRVRAKFAHLEQTWRSLAGRRVLAFWSNTQGNLLSMTRGMQVDKAARQADFDRLETALRRWLPDLLLTPVVHDDRIDPADPPHPGASHAYAAADPPGDWKGNTALWRQILHAVLHREGRLAPQPMRP